MISHEEADALTDMINSLIEKRLGNMKNPISAVYGTWVAAEASDANLSQVSLSGDGGTARFVPKGAHVTGLSAGQTVLCIKGPSVPLTIIARTVGDITLASI